MKDLKWARTVSPESIHSLLDDYLIFLSPWASTAPPPSFPADDLTFYFTEKTEEILKSSHHVYTTAYTYMLTLCLLLLLSMLLTKENSTSVLDPTFLPPQGHFTEVLFLSFFLHHQFFVSTGSFLSVNKNAVISPNSWDRDESRFLLILLPLHKTSSE